jgi:hypothetical protein
MGVDGVSQRERSLTAMLEGIQKDLKEGEIFLSVKSLESQRAG